ncbi:TPA: hypothetical protein ACJ689_001740, partial [Streptococcus pyogenes]
FDYSKFNSYIPYINYIFYRISSNPGLKEDEKVIDFVKRCNNLISSDYSAESWYSERQMQDVIKKINEKYTILEDSRINQIKFGREFRKSNLLILNAKEIKLKNRKEQG